MRRKVNRNVFNDRKNVSATPPWSRYWHMGSVLRVTGRSGWIDGHIPSLFPTIRTLEVDWWFVLVVVSGGEAADED